MSKYNNTNGLKWTIAITVVLVLALIAIVTYAICTKQIQYVEKAKDVVDEVTDPTVVEGGTQAVMQFLRI